MTILRGLRDQRRYWNDERRKGRIGIDGTNELGDGYQDQVNLDELMDQIHYLVDLRLLPEL